MTAINNQPIDSGNRQSFETGAVRDVPEGKGRFDLLPYEPLLQWAQWTEGGAKKYGDRNWEKGIPLMRYLDSAFRHLTKLIAGQRDENHEAAVIWNVGSYIQTLKWIEEGVLPSTLDDRPKRESIHSVDPKPLVTSDEETDSLDGDLARRDIEWIVSYIRDRLSHGSVSGVKMVGELRRAGHSYANILEGRDKAGVKIIVIDDLPHWKI